MSLRQKIELHSDPVIITGAGAGIGKATALGVASCGGTVLAVDQDEASLQVLAEEITAGGGQCRTYTADATNEDSVEALRRAIADDHAEVVGLVNVVGTNDPEALVDLSLQRWQNLLTANLTSTFLMTRGFTTLLRDGEGAIVNIASSYGLVGTPNFSGYAAAKGGVVNLTRQLAAEFASRGIRVNAICPGPTLTPRLKGYFESGRRQGDDARRTTLLGRFAEPHEIGNVVAFLLTPAASYVDGAIITVDGGQTCHTGAITS